MEQTTLELLADLHVHNHRQGPGSEQAFEQALALSGIDTRTPLSIADIGCGTGAATLSLLTHTNATVTAVDFVPVFLDKLGERARALNLTERLTVLNADMASLPFTPDSFDVIWAEGAIYNIGFENGVASWRPFIKPGGVLMVSEITWLTTDVPEPLRTHWEAEYPEIATAPKKFAVLESHGYTPTGYFVLPESCWLKEYYTPLQAGFDAFLERHAHSEAAKAIVESERYEIDLYTRYRDAVSYGCYIARRLP